MVFDKDWFKKHQKKVLWLANNWLTKYWFRWVLRINHDVSPSEGINFILPNAFSYENKVDFRTHDKFSKRLYFAFLPLWKLMHAWDSLIDNKIPAWSFGFDTLTAYPEAGSGGSNTTCDGYAYHFNSSGLDWSVLVAAAGYNANTTTNPAIAIYISADANTDKFDELNRFFATFDTSIISSSNIDSATLSFYGNDKIDGLSITPNCNVTAVTLANNNDIVAGDYDGVSNTLFSSNISYASFNASAYNDFTLNSSGISNINKTGVSAFAFRNQNYDVADSSPTWSSGTYSWFKIQTADQTGTSQDPKLVVEYSSGFTPKAIMF